MSREALEAAKRAKEAAKLLYGQEIYEENIGLPQHVAHHADDDIYLGSSAAQTFRGDSALDVVSYHDSTAGVTALINLIGQSQRSASGFAANDLLLDVEGVIGSMHRDTLVGNTDPNIFIGNGGNDTIHGAGGDDFLFGNAGIDTITALARSSDQVYIDGGTEADQIKVRTDGGDAIIWTGSGVDSVTIDVVSGRDFEIHIKDFQPYLEPNTTPTYAESLRGDNLLVRFNDDIAPGVSIASLAHFDDHWAANGRDFVLEFDHANVSGRIVLDNFIEFTGSTDFTFFVAHDYLPDLVVPV